MNNIIYPLKYKMSRREISDLHEALEALGLNIDENEKYKHRFGASTRKAVLTFQEKFDLKSTGEVDKKTATVLTNEWEKYSHNQQESERNDENDSDNDSEHDDENKKFHIKGKVVDHYTKKGIAKLRIEPWHNGHIIGKVSGKDVTDKYGKFQINIKDPDLDEWFEDDKPEIEFKVIRDDKTITIEEDAVSWKVKKQKAEVTIKFKQDDTVEAEFKVQGQIRNNEGSLLAGVTVRAVDKDLRSEQLLGEGITNSEGQYKISYSSDQFKRAEKETADLIIRVYDEIDNVIIESDIHFNSPEVYTVDLMQGDTDYAGLSDYEKLINSLQPVMEDILFSELTDDDVYFLQNETGIAEQGIEYLRTAAVLFDETTIPKEFFFSFFVGGLSTELAELVKQNDETLRDVLNTAFENNLINSRLKENIDESIQKLAVLRVDEVLEQPAREGVTPIKNILETTLTEPGLQQSFLSLYIDHVGPIENFWQDLRNNPDFQQEGIVEDLQTTLQLSLVLQGHAPMVSYIQQGLKDNNLPSVPAATNGDARSLSRLAALDSTAWVSLIEEQVDGVSIGVPGLTPGETTEEKVQNYSEAMAGTIEAAFPTPVIASRITRDRPDGVEDLEKFFDNNPELELTETAVDNFIAEKPEALDAVVDKEGTVNTLNTIQRVYKVAANYEITKTLISDGLTSATKIKSIGSEIFVKRYSDNIGGINAANEIFQRAEKISLQALSVYAKYASDFNAVDIAAIPRLNINNSTTNQSKAATISKNIITLNDSPVTSGENEINLNDSSTARANNSQRDWENLFGSNDLAYCKCDHCRSVYSPAAYLVDIINYLKSIKITNGTAADVLFSRRPDLAEIELSCDNTNLILPYIDLVNEVLENSIVETTFSYEVDSIEELDNRIISDETINIFNGYRYVITDDAYVTVDRLGRKWRIHSQDWIYVILNSPYLETQIIQVTAYPQTTGSRDQLQALPQHLNDNVYKTLKFDYQGNPVSYPWTLPFDLHWLQFSRYLEEFNLRRADILQWYQTPLTHETGPSRRERIACEWLEISPTECEIILQEDTSDIPWGGNDEDLSRVSELIKHSSLTYDELRQLLGTEYMKQTLPVIEADEPGDNEIAPFYSIAPELAGEVDTCNPESLIVTPKLTPHALDWFHRFVRLWRHTDWTISQLDNVLTILNNYNLQPIDDPYFPKPSVVENISFIKQLEIKLKLSVDELVEFWKESEKDKMALLAKMIKLKQDDMKSLKELMQVEPFNDPEATLEFVKRIESIQAKKYNVAELDYVYRDIDKPASSVKPLNIDVLEQLASIQDQLNSITVATIMPTVSTLDDLQRNLLLINPQNIVDKIIKFIGRLPEENRDTDENRAFIELNLPFLDIEDAAPVLLGVVAASDDERELYRITVIKYLLQKLLITEGGRQRRNLIIQVLSENMNIDTRITQVLLSQLLESSVDNTIPMMDDFLSLNAEGITVNYFDELLNSVSDYEDAVAASSTVKKNIDFTWGSSLPNGISNPDDGESIKFSTEITTRLFVTKEYAYSFHLRSSGGVRIWVSQNPIQPGTDTPIIDEWDNIFPKEFVSEPLLSDSLSSTYYVLIHFKNSAKDAFLQLSWSGEGLEKQVIPDKQLYTKEASNLQAIVDSYYKFHKAFLLVSGLGIGKKELLHFYTHGDNFEYFDVGKVNPGNFDSWLRVMEYVQLRENTPKGDYDLIDLFNIASNYFSPDELTMPVKEMLGNIYGWEQSDLDVFKSKYRLKNSDFRNELTLIKLKIRMDLSERIGVPPAVLFEWAEASADQLQVNQIENILKSNYSESLWLNKAKEINDPLREKRRTAMIDFLTTSRRYEGRWKDANDLYASFLIDTEMSACQETSRIKQAVSSIQLFIQRCLMNLESDSVIISDEKAREWKQWMKNYRVWEANRKIFLYPENYIEPQLRDDKTPFFIEMENELMQNEITDATSENALRHYLEKLDGVARLKVCGMYHQLETENDGGSLKQIIDVLHVIGRTFSQPHLYYYRKYIDASYWTPWEKIDVDIEGDHLIPVIYNRRLYLFWPVFRTEVDEELKTTPPKEDATAEEKTIKSFYKLGLAWSELKDGTWSAKHISPETLNTKGKSQDLDNYVFKSGFDNEGRLAVACYAQGEI